MRVTGAEENAFLYKGARFIQVQLFVFSTWFARCGSRGGFLLGQAVRLVPLAGSWESTLVRDG